MMPPTLRPALTWVPTVLLILAISLTTTHAASGGRSYEKGDLVEMYANKVGPFANPTETYRYFTLPLCGPKDESDEKLLAFGEVLEGHRLVRGPYRLPFNTPIESATLCSRHLSDHDLHRLQAAILEDYYFQLLMDGDLPVWGFIGKVEPPTDPDSDPHLLLFTHIHFDVLYNGNKLIQVDVSTDPASAVDITDTPPRTVEFTFSASWKPTDIPPRSRLDRYAKYSFLPQHLEVHWFSIVNSCATVLVLTGVLAAILLRVLRADVARYSDPEAADGSSEAGWKVLHGDVFRPPPMPELFAACVGAGSQFLVVAMAIFALALAGSYHPYNRGSLLASCVLFYSATAGVAGYVSGRLYRRLGGQEYTTNCAIVILLFCGPLLVAFSVLNSIAWAYGSTAALPFGTILIIVVLWAAVTLPLTIFSARMGRRGPSELNVPCRVFKHAREIPDLPWHRRTLPQIIAAGFLPFSAIYIELHYIFASVWGHKVYTIYSVLFVVFCVLLLVTAFVTVALTYFQLAAEDHRWWWRAFLCGGSTGGFVYAYAFYYFIMRSSMGGLMQTAFYFGYNFLVCWAVFLMLGAVGWSAAFAFTRYMFRAVKCD